MKLIVFQKKSQELQGYDNTVPQYNGILDAIKKIYKSEGIPGYYRGLLSSYAKTGPTLAIQFWTIEQLNYYLKNEDI